MNLKTKTYRLCEGPCELWSNGMRLTRPMQHCSSSGGQLTSAKQRAIGGLSILSEAVRKTVKHSGCRARLQPLAGDRADSPQQFRQACLVEHHEERDDGVRKRVKVPHRSFPHARPQDDQPDRNVEQMPVFDARVHGLTEALALAPMDGVGIRRQGECVGLE